MRTLKIQNGSHWVPKWPLGSGKKFKPMFLGTPIEWALHPCKEQVMPQKFIMAAMGFQNQCFWVFWSTFANQIFWFKRYENRRQRRRKCEKHEKVGGWNRITSSAESATLRDTSWARLTTELIRCLRFRWGGHCTFYFRTSGQIFKKGWGHRTFQLRLYGQMFKHGWGHRTQF